MEEATLLFRHLPTDLSVEERKDLLHHLGATRVQVMGRKGSMKNTAFAAFANKDEALKIVKQLHQVEFLGSKLRVEFAHKNRSRIASIVDNEGLESKEDPEREADQKDIGTDAKQEPREIKFDETFNTWGVKHVRRPDLCYLYPPPTPTTLTNIMHALAAVPRFYVQVLHLMNKMDLPAPFGAVTSAPPVQPDVRGYVVTDDAHLQEMDISSETESELESDGEERDKRSKDETQVKKPAATIGSRPERRRKRPRLSDLQERGMFPHPETAGGEPRSVREVFEQALSEYTAASKKIELKLPSTILSQRAPLPPPRPPPIPPATLVHPHGASSSSTLGKEHATQRSLEMQSQTPAPLPSSLSSQQFSDAGQFSASGGRLGTLAASNQSEVYSQNSSQPLHSSLTASEQQEVAVTGQSGNNPQNLYDVQLPPGYSEPQEPAASGDDRYRLSWQDASPSPKGIVSSGLTSQDVLPSEATPSGDACQADATEGGGGFGILQPQPRTKEASDGSEGESAAEKEWTQSKFISSTELRRSRLSISEMKEYSVFRRYSEGDRSCRLYIKNLSKQVTEEDIHWIYGRYVDWNSPTDKNIFDIRLMKEGRMKGQAFVTLPSEDAAASALKDTNGFRLKEKPMVVHFARSAKAPEDSASKP